MYLPFNHILLRFPYFSFTKLSEFFNDEDKVKKIFNDSLFQEAIYIASPVLYIEMMKYLENKLPEKEKSKIFYTLIRYFSRMCTRCTPFGLFSNVSIGEIDKIDNFILNYNIKKTVRLDNYVLNLSLKKRSSRNHDTLPSPSTPLRTIDARTAISIFSI